MKKGGVPALPGRRKPYVMAHRGNRVRCPENTTAAFRQALEDGADILETDLHLSADDEFICIHDATVDRTTDGRGTVAELTLKQLKKLDASCGRPQFAGQRIPTLRETMGLLPADVALALELKTDRFLDPVIGRRLSRELQEGGVRDRTLLISFELPRVQAVRAVAEGISIGWISLTRPWPYRGTDVLGAFWPLLLLNPFYVWLAHLRGQAVCPLDPAPDKRLRLYTFLRCDAVLTDDPAATRQALRREERP